MVLIRADGNPAIGMGHIMRCLAIADAMEEKPVFVTACEECRPIIEKQGYRAVVLPTDYRRMEEEPPLLEKLAAEAAGAAETTAGAAEVRATAAGTAGSAVSGKRPVFLVDSYQVTEEYFRRLKKLGAVACLEDLGISYPADLLINYNLYAPKLRYGEGLRTLLGTAYVPLRREFAQTRIGQEADTDRERVDREEAGREAQAKEDCAGERRVRERVGHVLITTGGGDPFFAAAGFLDAFLADGQIEGGPVFHVVSGPMNKYAGELRAGYGGNPQVRIHERVTDMRGIMEQCDVALTAAGSSVYELCSLGIPMICFYFAENQRQGAECLAEQTDIVNAGNYAENAGKTVQKALGAIRRCMEEPVYRSLLASQERRLVDGQGARRIAEELLRL